MPRSVGAEVGAACSKSLSPRGLIWTTPTTRAKGLERKQKGLCNRDNKVTTKSHGEQRRKQKGHGKSKRGAGKQQSHGKSTKAFRQKIKGH